MTQLFANNAASELASAVTSGDVSLTLKAGDGAKFPTPSGGDFFLVTLYQKAGQDEINHEIVKCTARAGDVLTVVRAQEGTTARAFNADDPVELRLTAGSVATKDDLTTKQPLDADLTAIAALAGTSGLLKKTAENSWELDTTAYSTLTLGTTAGTALAGNTIFGDVTLTGAQTLTNKTLTSPTLTGAVLNDGYTEEVFAVTGTAPALSPTYGSIQTWTLTGNSTPTAGTWAAGQSITLMVDDGSAYTINWASMSITWKTGGGTAPTLLTTGYTVIELAKVGSTIYGWLAGDA